MLKISNIFKARLTGTEPESFLSKRSIALLPYNEIDKVVLSFVALFHLHRVHMEEGHCIRIAPNAVAIPNVVKLWHLSSRSFAVQLSQGHHRNIQFLGQALQIATDFTNHLVALLFATL